jgi:hypothetical protein
LSSQSFELAIREQREEKATKEVKGGLEDGR